MTCRSAGTAENALPTCSVQKTAHGRRGVVTAADGSGRPGLRCVVATEVDAPERLANRRLPLEPALAKPRKAMPASNASRRLVEDVTRPGNHLQQVGPDLVRDCRIVEGRQRLGTRSRRQGDQASTLAAPHAVRTPPEKRVVAQQLERESDRGNSQQLIPGHRLLLVREP